MDLQARLEPNLLPETVLPLIFSSGSSILTKHRRFRKLQRIASTTKKTTKSTFRIIKIFENYLRAPPWKYCNISARIFWLFLMFYRAKSLYLWDVTKLFAMNVAMFFGNVARNFQTIPLISPTFCSRNGFKDGHQRQQIIPIKGHAYDRGNPVPVTVTIKSERTVCMQPSLAILWQAGVARFIL